MSILETFYILFKTDADDAAKDINEVDKASDKAAAGLNKVDAAAGGVGASFKRMAAAIAGPLLTLATAGAALNIAIERAAAVRELDSFSTKLNSSIEDVDAFQRAVKGLGGETAGAVDSLVKLGEKVNEAFSDAESGARKDFKEWGLAFKDSKGQALGASDAMLELARNLEGVSNAEALARIKKLGIEDATTIEALMLGRRTLEDHIRAQKEMGVVTEENAFAVREYYSALGDAQNALTSIGNKILSALIPAMTKAVEVFADLAGWVSRNGTLVTGFFIGVAGVITAMYLPAITAAAAATIAATWPFLAIAAAIAAVGTVVALVYEDIMAFLNGQPSLIGALAERYQIVADVIGFIGDQFNNLKIGAVQAFELLKQGWAAFVDAANSASEGMAAFWASVKPIWDALAGLVGSVVDLIDRAGAALGEKLAPGFKRMGESFEAVKKFAVDMFEAIFGNIDDISTQAAAAADAFEKVFSAAFTGIKLAWDYTVGAIVEGIKNLTGWLNSITFTTPSISPANDNMRAGGAAIGAMMGQGQGLTAAASGASINSAGAVAGGAGVTNTSNVSVGNVTVNTQATDAAGVASAVKGELQKQLRGTAAQLDDGVDR